MKRLARFLVPVVVAALMLSISVSAAAAGRSSAFSDVSSSSDYNKDFSLLAAMEVFLGYGDGRVGPNDPLTRAQFSAVVVRMINRESTAQSLAHLETNFNDDASIPSWARGYIQVAHSLGIIEGHPNGTFEPNGNVTYEQALVMLLRALGLEKAVVGPWPTGVILAAEEVGLTDDIVAIPGAPISRADMAVITVAALQSEYRWDSTSESLKTGGESLLEKRWDDRWVTGEVTAATSSSVTFGTKKVDFASTYYMPGLESVAALEGLQATAFLDADGELVFISTDETVDFVTGTFEELDGDTVVLTNGTEIDLASGYVVEINGRTSLGTSSFDADDLEEDDALTVTLNSDGDALRIRATRLDVLDALVMNFSSSSVFDWDSSDDEGTLEYWDGETPGSSRDIDVDDETLWYIDGDLSDVSDVMDIHDVAAIDMQTEGLRGLYAQKVYIYTDTESGDVTEIRATSSGYYTLILEDDDGDETEYRVSQDGFYDQPSDVWRADSSVSVLEGGSVVVLLNSDRHVRAVVDSTAGEYTYGLVTSIASDNDPITVKVGSGSSQTLRTDSLSYDFTILNPQNNYIGYIDFQANGRVDNFEALIWGDYFDELASCSSESCVEAVHSDLEYGTVYSASSSSILVEDDDSGALVRPADGVLVFDESGDFIGRSGLDEGDDVVYMTVDGTQGENADDANRIVLIIKLDW